MPVARLSVLTSFESFFASPWLRSCPFQVTPIIFPKSGKDFFAWFVCLPNEILGVACLQVHRGKSTIGGANLFDDPA